MRSVSLPGSALGQNRLERAAQEQRPPQFAVRLMPEQIAVKFAVRGQQLRSQQLDDRPGLADVAERRRILSQLVQSAA